ncbi:MAG: signal peptide peptidase SppA [Spirochaetota bacterium]|nr:signal peptide peptidase SppA [Spirochaetota bacterium]
MFLFFIITACINISFAESSTTFDMPLPDSSVSHVETPFAHLINPVFSDLYNRNSFSYRFFNYNEEKKDNHLFTLNLYGFAFSYIWYNNIYDYESGNVENSKTKLFNVSKGFFFDNIFGFGIDYSFSQSRYSRYNNYKSFSLGFLYRPARFLSLGYVVRNLNKTKLNNEAVKRKQVYSFSVKPYKDYITLSLDAQRLSGEKFKKSNFLFSVNLHLIHDISILGSWDNDRNVTFGISIPLGTGKSSIILDCYAAGSSKSKRDFSTFGLSYLNERFPSQFLLSKRILLINIKEDTNEIEADSLFGYKGISMTLCNILMAIEEAGQDDTIVGVILQIDRSRFGFAEIQELKDSLKRFKKRGKYVYSILTGYGNQEYYLAASANKIYYAPCSTFSITGISAEVYFFKGIFDKAGIKYESVKLGKYKSFNEPFTRESMSDEYRENITTLLTDINEQYVNDIMEERKISRKSIEEMFSKGVLSPEQAVKVGFIDEIEYPEEAKKKIIEKYSSNLSIVKIKDYFDENVRSFTWGALPSIAIIYVSGAIVRGKSKYSRFNSGSIGDETYKKAIKQAFRNDSIKAVIIRINSGGGSAIASELMWHYLHQMKNKYKKPVIFSFGNIAASGGYYIACTGDKIFGSKGSITGSIGVISGKLSLKRLYKKIGINSDTIKMSKFADIFSLSKDLNESEREVLQMSVNYIYERFTEKVSKWRKIWKEKIPEVAEGRVFSGSQANKKGLIDNIGSLIAAIEFAKALVKIQGEFQLVHLPEKRVSIVDMMGLFTNKVTISDELLSVVSTIEDLQFGGESFLYYFPYKIVIK